MSDAVSAPPLDVSVVAQRLLSASAIAWFVPACVGQWIFTGYIVLKYVAPALRGDVSGWNDVMVNGLIPGDLAGNIALGVHLFIAFAITAGGTLQLIPAVRRGAPSFHRWNGRAYVVIALITSLAALYMTWTRHQLGGVVSAVGISLDAVLIIFFSGMTFVSARSRRFGVHHDWALRTFVAVSAVWYMRVSYGFLILAFQGQPPGSYGGGGYGGGTYAPPASTVHPPSANQAGASGNNPSAATRPYGASSPVYADAIRPAPTSPTGGAR